MAMVLFGQDLDGYRAGSNGGGIVTSLLVWLLAWRNGIDTFRLIIIGIGVRAMLVAFNTWLLLKASLETALTAGLWNAGSLNGLTWAKNLTFRTHHYINVNCRRLAGAANALAGNGR